jgi:peptide/nickel transport system permease protein
MMRETGEAGRRDSAGGSVGVGAIEVEALEERFGLDKPLYVQYLKWIGGVVRGDMGMSMEWRIPVNELIKERLVLTLILSGATILFAWTLAIPIGIISAVKQYSVIDYAFTFLAYIGVGTPNFMLALVIMWTAFAAFGLRLTGLFSPEYVDAPWSVGRFVDMMSHMWVPVLILGTDGTARFTRIIRANLLDELGKPYVETARAKGIPETRVVLRYPVRMALNPFVSTVGWALPQLFSGSLIVATVMSLPTIGPLLLSSLLSQDMFLAGSLILILTALTLTGTLISDLILAWMDPRIRMKA